MNKQSNQENSRLKIIAKLRAEHHEMLLLLAIFASKQETQMRLQLCEMVCAKTRLHYTAELGVFFPALKGLCGGDQLISDAAGGYVRAIELVNELAGVSADRRLARLQINFLRDEILNHIKAAEAADGAFELSAHADAAWDAIDASLSERRSSLEQLMKEGAARGFF